MEKIKNQSPKAPQPKGPQPKAPKPKALQPKSPKSKGIEEKMPLNKMNYIMIGVCLFLIAVGFFLMSGSSNEGPTFNNDVFSSTRTVVAPFITFLGFILMVPAILYRGKNTEQEEEQ